MNTLDAIFKPKSIAIIGATTRKGSIGREIIHNLFAFEFNGMIFPVNPRYEYIHSTKAYPTVLSIPDPVDLAPFTWNAVFRRVEAVWQGMSETDQGS